MKSRKTKRKLRKNYTRKNKKKRKKRKKSKSKGCSLKTTGKYKKIYKKLNGKGLTLGMITVPLSPDKQFFQVCGDSYIASSHITWLKRYGVRIIPIPWSTKKFDYYLISSVLLNLIISLFQILISFAGKPATTLLSFILLVTPLFPAIVTLLPILRCPEIPDWPPILTKSPIIVLPAIPT